MTALDRKPRPLVVSPAIARSLLELIQLEGGRPTGELPLSTLCEVERELGCFLHDDVLAVLCSQANEFFDIRGVLPHTIEARRQGCPGDFIAIGKLVESECYYCVKARAPADDSSQLIQYARDSDTHYTTLARRLADCVDYVREVLARRAASGLAHTVRDPITAFTPALVAPASPPRTIVRHDVFGEGELVRELGSGESRKLEIRFASGTKVLLARFVRPI